uniref:Uncharacterized protein n=1 Tax=Romanomermis culicivorax TaxID=13658 RepID=A0A915KWL1_ROMCU
MKYLDSEELIVNVPLAVLDDDDDESDMIFEKQQNEISSDIRNLPKLKLDISDSSNSRFSFSSDTTFSAAYYANSSSSYSEEISSFGDHGARRRHTSYISDENDEMDTFSDTLAVSLENLVTSFDEKVSHCLKNLTEKTDEIAPVVLVNNAFYFNAASKFLVQDDASNFPEDVKAHESSLFSVRSRQTAGSTDSCVADLSYEDEHDQAKESRSDRSDSDFSNGEFMSPLPQTADQVIEEIDQLMQESCNSDRTATSDYTMESACSPLKSPSEVKVFISGERILNFLPKNAANLSTSIEELKSVPIHKLKSYRLGFEALIKIYNEALVHELALRDELVYEKELKNTFISLMSAIQSKKRKFHLDSKRRRGAGRMTPRLLLGNFGQNSRPVPQYLTTVIPYDIGSPLSNHNLEALINTYMLKQLLLNYLTSVQEYYAPRNNWSSHIQRNSKFLDQFMIVYLPKLLIMVHRKLTNELRQSNAGCMEQGGGLKIEQSQEELTWQNEAITLQNDFR